MHRNRALFYCRYRGYFRGYYRGDWIIVLLENMGSTNICISTYMKLHFISLTMTQVSAILQKNFSCYLTTNL